MFILVPYWSDRSSVVDDVSSREPRGPLAGWHVDQVIDGSGWTWSVVTNQMTTDRSGGSEVRGYVDPERWSVVSNQVTTNIPVSKWTPGGRTREAIEHRSVIGCMVIGVSCYTQLNWDWGSQRERYAWTPHEHISWNHAWEWPGDSLNPSRARFREG